MDDLKHDKAQEILHSVQAYYDSIPEPRYKNISISEFYKYFESLKKISSSSKDDPVYKKLINGMSQINSKQQSGKVSYIISERGLNKSIVPVLNKGNSPSQLPFSWIDKSGAECTVSNGYWGAKNYMVMDILGLFLLLKLGGDKILPKSDPLFDHPDAIQREELNTEGSESIDADPTGSTLDQMKKSEYWIKFSDKQFRQFSGKSYGSNKIYELLLQTARVEFKISFPVRLLNDHSKHQEYKYNMNIHSRLFEVGEIPIKRKDGQIKSREYYVFFNTFLGKLFVSNLISHNYDWISSSIYSLPDSAQLFYRILLLHHDYSPVSYNLHTIASKLNYRDKDNSNLQRTIEKNALQPLRDHGLIKEYSKEDGLNGVRYVIKWYPKKDSKELRFNHKAESEVRKEISRDRKRMSGVRK